ncbi:MAG: helix-turn-helix domain-containing protein [Ruminococcus sp.]|nr:helix-turn-helix domain-containing protein [Ruminococcus sp.]
MYVDYKQVGKRIAKRRKELGLKQTEVTEMAGLSEKYLSNIERATSVLSIDVLMKLCAVLKTTPNALLLGSETELTPSDFSLYISENITNMSGQQMALISSFIEWVSQQEI